jgi:hypothetical protein
MVNKCEICGYYEDLIAWHYEDCPLLEEKLKESE